MVLSDILYQRQYEVEQGMRFQEEENVLRSKVMIRNIPKAVVEK